MSTTLPIPTTPIQAANGAAMSPMEFVRTMSPEAKEDVFVALLEELVARSSKTGLIPFEAANGQFLGYFVPPAAAKELADKEWSEMPPQVREHLGRPVEDLDNCISADEMLAHLKQEAGSRLP